jgi:phosphate-selective porin OprO/OprP
LFPADYHIIYSSQKPLFIYMNLEKLKTNIKKIHRLALLPGISLSMLLTLPHQSFSQEIKKEVPDGTTGTVLEIGKSDYLDTKEKPNEFHGTYSTCRLGFGYILDGASYSEDAVFKQQMDSAGLDLVSKVETRDFRAIVSGVFKTKRTVAWKMAYMYDGDAKTWLMRETGITIGVPEAAGHIFIGRTKEGYSMVKVMNGHSPWTPERQMALDVIPILADGIKYFGFLPKSRIFWNLGYFNDVISKDQSFSTYAWQGDARVGWLPIYDKEKNKVLHIGGNFRYGKTVSGSMTLKSRPESNPSPQIINTGAFPADYSTHMGAEAYYSNGKLMIGSEVMVHNFQSKNFDDHQFFGGDVAVSYFFTQGGRPYNAQGNVFGFVPVNKSLFKGGIGEIEAVLRLSSLDLNDGSIQGGKFWRITPMINWYMAKTLRLEFIYGYGVLDRYNLEGTLQIYQVRLQLSVF